MGSGTQILFTGYAPVHFLCFMPLYERLRKMKGVEVFVSGGLRTPTDDGFIYDGCGLYASFDICDDHILSVEEIRKRRFDILFAGNTKMIEPGEVGRKIQIFHGISFRNKAVRAENANADHYFMVGPYMRRRFDEGGIIRSDDPRGLDIGFMKTDRLINGTLNRRSIVERHGLDGSRPVLLYAPTGQKNNSLETMGIEVIRKIAESNQFDLVIKTHDHPKRPDADCYRELGTLGGDHVKITREQDVIPLLYMADLLITDASSVSNEYSLLDRPMVFLDVPKLIKRASSDGSMVDLDTWGRRGGRIVDSPSLVVSTIEESLANPAEFSDIRKTMVADLFFNPGCATDAAVEWLTTAIGLPHGALPASEGAESAVVGVER